MSQHRRVLERRRLQYGNSYYYGGHSETVLIVSSSLGLIRLAPVVLLPIVDGRRMYPRLPFLFRQDQQEAEAFG